jgi:hypothetical protein
MLNPDFRDILSEFNAEGVEYLLVGAYALAAHGLPRATGDIDLWVRPSAGNAERVWRAGRSCGPRCDAGRTTPYARTNLLYATRCGRCVRSTTAR